MINCSAERFKLLSLTDKQKKSVPMRQERQRAVRERFCLLQTSWKEKKRKKYVRSAGIFPEQDELENAAE